MKKSVYETGHYNATTLRYPGVYRQIVSKIRVHTPRTMVGENKSIELVALWDTGATGSCISKKYADELGLKPIEYCNSYGVGGSLERVAVYEIVVDLNSSLKGLRTLVSEAKLHKDDGGPLDSEIGFLIGMNIIGLGDFFTGQYLQANKQPGNMFSFRIPSANEPVDYYQEIKAFNLAQKNLKTKNEYRKYIGGKKK